MSKTWLFTEEDEQAGLMSWIDLLAGRYPALEMVLHVANEGRRHPRKARRMGIRAGVPDLLLPVPDSDGDYIGLAIEMKRGDNKPSKSQEWWLEALESVGWQCHVHTSHEAGDWQKAALIICDYLEIDEEVRRWLI